MPFDSLGDFIKAADAVGEVQFVEGVDLELDIGGLTELTAERNGPMLVVDKFAGRHRGAIYRARFSQIAVDCT